MGPNDLVSTGRPVNELTNATGFQFDDNDAKKLLMCLQYHSDTGVRFGQALKTD
jgi:hypothetical protein